MELPVFAGGVGSVGVAVVTAKMVAVPAIAIMIPATIASRVPLFTIFYDNLRYLRVTMVIEVNQRWVVKNLHVTSVRCQVHTNSSRTCGQDGQEK